LCQKGKRRTHSKTFTEISPPSAGVSHELLYKVVRESFLGVTRDDVQAFLRKQWPYQLTRPWPAKKVNKSLTSRSQNEVWTIDLVDNNRYKAANDGFRYICTVLDNFTSYVFARKVRDKTSAGVRAVLESVATEAGAHPRVPTSDLGKEFRGSVQEWAGENGVKRSFTKSCTPLGRHERFNGLLRERLRDVFARQGDVRWVDDLEQAVQQVNRTPHAGQKYSPVFLYLSQGEDVTEEHKEATETLEKRAEKQVLKNKAKS
jgi:transposase InsO family protein